MPSHHDSKIEFTTFKNLSKLDKKEDAKETELEAGATGEFGEGIPGVIIMESEPVTDLETQALITGEDSEKTEEEKKEEMKDDAKDEPKDTSEPKQQETGGIEVPIIIESSIINMEAKTTADAQTSGSDDIDCFSKESTTVDTSGIENNPKPSAAVDVTDGSTKQEVSPKRTMRDEKQSNKEEEGREGERKTEGDVKKEEPKMEDKQEAGRNDLSEDILTKSTDVFNMQLGAILDLIKDDDKDTKTQTIL